MAARNRFNCLTLCSLPYYQKRQIPDLREAKKLYLALIKRQKLRALQGFSTLISEPSHFTNSCIIDSASFNRLQAASDEGHDKAVKLLLDKGADVNAQGGHFGNALQAASFEGHDKIIELLLGKGADVNARGGQYGNALHAASSQGHDKTIELLLGKGADLY